MNTGGPEDDLRRAYEERNAQLKAIEEGRWIDNTAYTPKEASRDIRDTRVWVYQGTRMAIAVHRPFRESLWFLTCNELGHTRVLLSNHISEARRKALEIVAESINKRIAELLADQELISEGLGR